VTNRASTLLTDIAACLCAEVNPDDNMCFCGVIAGTAAVHDFWPDCTNDGMAWVRLALAYPSTALGIADQTPGAKGKMVGLDIEIGLVRSYEVDEQDGSINAAEYARMMVQSGDDMMAMRKVISCCPALNERDFILGTWTPIGPTGLVYGGAWTLFSQVH
jgi:hypothetical protein